MDMDPTSSASSSGMEVMMTPWLHFKGGDNLLFKSLRPTSNGAIAGACIVLVAIAILDRWVSGVRGVLEKHWKASAMHASYKGITPSTPAEVLLPSPSKDKASMAIDEVDINPQTSLGSQKVGFLRQARAIPPFILTHDVPRGAIYALQALLGYALMLAVMSFQAAYLIAIVVGLGIGELLFGRMRGAAQSHVVH